MCLLPASVSYYAFLCWMNECLCIFSPRKLMHTIGKSALDLFEKWDDWACYVIVGKRFSLTFEYFWCCFSLFFPYFQLPLKATNPRFSRTSLIVSDLAIPCRVINSSSKCCLLLCTWVFKVVLTLFVSASPAAIPTELVVHTEFLNASFQGKCVSIALSMRPWFLVLINPT